MRQRAVATAIFATVQMVIPPFLTVAGIAVAARSPILKMSAAMKLLYNDLDELPSIVEFVMDTMVEHYKECPILWPINKISSYPKDYDGFHREQAYRKYAKIHEISLLFDWEDDLIVPEEFKAVWEQKRRNWDTEVHAAVRASIIKTLNDQR